MLRGDRVANGMLQRFQTAVVYMAVLQRVAVAVPLSTLFGPEALVYRLADSEAVVAIADDGAERRARCLLRAARYSRCRRSPGAG